MTMLNMIDELETVLQGSWDEVATEAASEGADAVYEVNITPSNDGGLYC